MSAPVFRQASAAQLHRVLDWAAEEGWNPGLDDAAAFHAADPGGFFLAEVGGAAVAAISVVNHSDTFAFLGLYLCRPAFRGKGLGYALWQHALPHAGARTVGLDGVAAQQANYAVSGFVRTGASVRFQGVVAPEADPAVRPAGPEDAAALAACDAAANGMARPAFLAAWTQRTATRCTVVRADGSGFATIRRCRLGAKIGPIVAPDAAGALALARAALAELPAEPVIVDLPSKSSALADTLQTLGFAPTFETARMYRGAPPTPGPSLHAIATMELG